MPLFDPPEESLAYFHRCGKLPAEGIDVVYSSREVLDRPPCWVMTICREATESDLEESDILEEVGDSIWTVTAEITHCPYCGECLQTADMSESEIEVEDDSRDTESYEAFGAFVLFDQGSWSGSRR